MGHRRPSRPRPPLDPSTLHELALAYVGRFATTRAKLVAYLGRKVRERGWDGEDAPDLPSLAERFAASGLIDDQAFALARSASLGRRGYGEGRVKLALRAAGIEEDDRSDALTASRREAVETALHFARRRRIGPFAREVPTDRKARDKLLAAMLRAGHSMGLSIAILNLDPGSEPDLEELGSKIKHTDE